jgi:ribonuclease E
MLIDAVHPEETRVAVVEDNRLEEFDFESSTKVQLKGNIFLAKVVRVEPSLQAAFVDYGGERHGFLSLHEIHPDYYQLPTEDREEFEQWVANAQSEDASPTEDSEEDPEHESSDISEEDETQKAKTTKLRLQFLRRYKIQEVIKRRQILLVQVVKEERGNKGAALTTYLSLAGRYIVLMPNSGRGKGISRKITNLEDRKRLKGVLESLDLPQGMGVVARTAGIERSKTDIQKDYEYLLKIWDQIRSTTLQSIAPCLVHEEASLIKRTLRDMYTRDMVEILVEGEKGYKTARSFIKSFMPSHARRVQLFKDTDRSLFQKHGLEAQIANIYETRVNLSSGGYLVVNVTEALIAIDVNSGRATRERNVEETAVRTNLEAATEIARQLRIRDLAGLIVVDFIDMAEQRNNTAVERRMKDAIKGDRARIQIGKISSFGLMELSRQRLGRSVYELSTFPCPCCSGIGVVRSTESIAIHVLRAIETEIADKELANARISVAPLVANYLLNYKRGTLWALESKGNRRIIVEADASLSPAKFEIKIETITEHASDDEEVLEVMGKPHANKVLSSSLSQPPSLKNVREVSKTPPPKTAPLSTESSSKEVEKGDVPLSVSSGKEPTSQKKYSRSRKQRKKFSLPDGTSSTPEPGIPLDDTLKTSETFSQDQQVSADKQEKSPSQALQRQSRRPRRYIKRKVVSTDVPFPLPAQEEFSSIIPVDNLDRFEQKHPPQSEGAAIPMGHNSEDPRREGWWQRLIK